MYALSTTAQGDRAPRPRSTSVRRGDPHTVRECEDATVSTMQLISVVDDDHSVCRALRRLLEATGYAVETFASGREFLHSSAPGRTACLVLDIHLGEMSGFELQEQLAAAEAAIPIIFITAHDDALVRERIARSGVAAYLCKPFDERVLLDAIRTAVGQADGGDGGDDDPAGSRCVGATRGPFPSP